MLRLSKDDGRELACYGTVEGFEVVSNEVVDTSRWSTIHELVIRRTEDDTLWIGDYSRGATEQQDESPYQYDSHAEFFPAEEYTVVKYRAKKETK